jgi:hypothetical protein
LQLGFFSCSLRGLRFLVIFFCLGIIFCTLQQGFEELKFSTLHLNSSELRAEINELLCN